MYSCLFPPIFPFFFFFGKWDVWSHSQPVLFNSFSRGARSQTLSPLQNLVRIARNVMVWQWMMNAVYHEIPYVKQPMQLLLQRQHHRQHHRQLHRQLQSPVVRVYRKKWPCDAKKGYFDVFKIFFWRNTYRLPTSLHQAAGAQKCCLKKSCDILIRTLDLDNFTVSINMIKGI